ncbi:hypothetical protein ABB39_12220 [Levilactobacillus brevis]|uniref:hypothetical protein n=1 Tax=Levilactobacillus brevis TaxID=1580 RepID=UPI0007608948|nr:hypothetical protein [Levilactobacillus brevis]KWT43581.1 hypothetical protein ABB39_12220 [Levilactobacillus brevis]
MELVDYEVFKQPFYRDYINDYNDIAGQSKVMPSYGNNPDPVALKAELTDKAQQAKTDFSEAFNAFKVEKENALNEQKAAAVPQLQYTDANAETLRRMDIATAAKVMEPTELLDALEQATESATVDTFAINTYKAELKPYRNNGAYSERYANIITGEAQRTQAKVNQNADYQQALDEYRRANGFPADFATNPWRIDNGVLDAAPIDLLTVINGNVTRYAASLKAFNKSLA